MIHFINAREALVTKALDGSPRGRSGTLARLDGYPHIKVVPRTDWLADKVALNGFDAKLGDGDTGSTLAGAARTGAEATRTMTVARAGRAAYVSADSRRGVLRCWHG